MTNLDVRALVKLAEAGAALFASRILTVIALLGILALCAYVAYRPTWEGVAVVVAASLFVFKPALNAESGQREQPARSE